MDLVYKEDWAEAEKRMDAWWHGAVLDRAVVQVTAPGEGVHPPRDRPSDIPEDELEAWFVDPDRVIPRIERQVASTYWGGEAFPIVYPVSISLVAILAAYLGCPYQVVPVSYSGWALPIIQDWEERPGLGFDPNNPWWQRSRRLLDAAARRASGRYYVGGPPSRRATPGGRPDRASGRGQGCPARDQPRLVALLGGSNGHSTPMGRRLLVLDGAVV